MGSERDGAGQNGGGQNGQDRLIVRTVAIADPGDLLGWLPDASPLAWVRRGDGLVGWGEAARMVLPAGPDRFAAGEKRLREVFDAAEVTDDVKLPGTGPVAFGSFTFDPASEGSVLVIPQVILGRRDGLAWLTTIAAGAELRAVAGQNAGRNADQNAGLPPDRAAVREPVPPGSVRWSDGNLTAPQWEQAVAAAVARITAGELSKVVLATDLIATAAQDIDARALLNRLADRYADCYTFACAGLIGATPELLIRRDGDRIRSLVLAGTFARGRTAAEDEALGAALLGSAKDVEEHQYAVRDVGEALRPLCADLRVAARPALLRLANLQHLATEVDGRLAAGEAAAHSVLSLVAALHPTAAVGGTPTETAMELIRELEGMDRGRYAGPVGWIDGSGNGEWGIALRCGQISGRQARLFAGCGIVAGSDPAAEFAEAQAKFRPMRHALEG